MPIVYLPSADETPTEAMKATPASSGTIVRYFFISDFLHIDFQFQFQGLTLSAQTDRIKAKQFCTVI
jgi:hypothetical protein